MRTVFSRLTFANVMSVTAVFIALGGGAYAVTVAKNTVKSKSIKDGAIKGKDVGANTLTGVNVNEGTLTLPPGPTGPRGLTGETGPAGATGPTGPAGDLVAYARVDSDAARTLQPDVAGFPPQVKGVTQAGVVPGEGGAATGTTCFDLSFRPASALVTLDNADAGANVDLIASVAIDRGQDLGDCPATHNDARVRILDTDVAAGAPSDPGPANARFFVWFE